MIHIVVLSAVLVSSVTYSEEKASRDRRIVSGTPLTKNEWPFLVSLHYLLPHEFTNITKMKHLCGGALIHPQWVLTAAHCFWSRGMDREENWNVVLGEYNQYLIEDGEQTIKPEKFFIHPQYFILQNDIALVKLKEEANLTSSVDVIHISNNTGVEVDTECKIGGWGQITENPENLGMFLPLKTHVSVLNISTCYDSYTQMHALLSFDSSVICVGNPEGMGDNHQVMNGKSPDSCNGDSGGPLLCPTGNDGQDHVSGIVSFGRGCGRASTPGVYTNVSFFTGWITDVMENN